MICLKPNQEPPEVFPRCLGAVFFFMTKSLMGLNLSENFLITTDAWFVAPDGQQYRAVWGKVTVHTDEETLGIKTNAKSSNWYVLVGSEEKRVVIAGCQIHYACVSKEKPNTNDVKETWVSPQQAKVFDGQLITKIYLAQ